MDGNILATPLNLWYCFIDISTGSIFKLAIETPSRCSFTSKFAVLGAVFLYLNLLHMAVTLALLALFFVLTIYLIKGINKIGTYIDDVAWEKREKELLVKIEDLIQHHK